MWIKKIQIVIIVKITVCDIFFKTKLCTSACKKKKIMLKNKYIAISKCHVMAHSTSNPWLKRTIIIKVHFFIKIFYP